MTATSNVGAIGENLVINDLLKHDCRVYKEVTGGNDVDLVAYIGTKFVRVQVKTHAECKKGVLPASRERRWRNKDGDWVRTHYTADTVDIIAVVALDHNVIAYVPLTEFGEQITMCIRFESPRNGQKKSVRSLSDFSFERIISV